MRTGRQAPKWKRLTKSTKNGVVAVFLFFFLSFLLHLLLLHLLLLLLLLPAEPEAARQLDRAEAAGREHGQVDDVVGRAVDCRRRRRRRRRHAPLGAAFGVERAAAAAADAARLAVQGRGQDARPAVDPRRRFGQRERRPRQRHHPPAVRSLPPRFF